MALTDKLTALGDAIRKKNGATNPMTLDEMVVAIDGLSEGLTNEDLTFSGQLNYFNANGRLNKLFEKYGNKITFNNPTSFQYAFYVMGLEEFPYTISGGASNGTQTNTSYMFYNNPALKKIGELKNIIPSAMQHMFGRCENLHELPQMTDWDFSYLHKTTGNFSYMFDSCYSLRKIPPELLKELWGSGTSSSSYVWSGCHNCCALDELRDLPLGNKTKTYTSNRWTAPNYLYHIKDILFETQEDGTPYTIAQKNMTIIIPSYYGWCPSDKRSLLLNYNSGITRDKEVSDTETYQALKNDPDWYSISKDYSRYNRQSAINTIATLPDTSAYLAENGGTNTIKFASGLGKLTDAGGVDDLTPEEIAVAVAKGWTVSFE